jgi:hypothetical protein
MSRWMVVACVVVISGGSCSLASARHGSHHGECHEHYDDGDCRHFEFEHHRRGAHEHFEDYHRSGYEHMDNGAPRRPPAPDEAAPAPPPQR